MRQQRRLCTFKSLRIENKAIAQSASIILEFGNTAELCGSGRTAYRMSVTATSDSGGLNRNARIKHRNNPKAPLLVKVEFNINPSYNKQTFVATRPDSCGVEGCSRSAASYSFEYSMRRPFPVVTTVHFNISLGIPPLELDYYAQNETCKRFIFVQFPTRNYHCTGKANGNVKVRKRLKKKPIRLTVDPPRNVLLRLWHEGSEREHPDVAYSAN